MTTIETLRAAIETANAAVEAATAAWNSALAAGEDGDHEYGLLLDAQDALREANHELEIEFA